MGPDLSHFTSSARFPRILIAENNFATVESLVQSLGDRRLDVDFDVCTSHDHAVVKLFRSPPPYQLIISAVHLAAMKDFFLLKHNHNLQPFVPFVVTSAASDIKSSRRALEEGALDVIHTPLEHEQTVCTIRLALWHNKLKALIASRDKTVERYRQHMADFPDDRWNIEETFKRIISVFEKTISSVESTMLRLEESTVSDFATKVEHYYRNRALERLDSLNGLAR